MRTPLRLLVALFCLASLLAAADLRVGMIGTDTSHVIEFTRMFNDANDPEHVAGARVVAAYKGGSPDVASSRDRVEKFARQLADTYKVELVPDIPSLCGRVDALLLESVDGRVHLEQARQALQCHKPMFIDKPLASTLRDAREIARIAAAAGVPWFSASSLRYSDIALKLASAENRGATAWGPGPLEPHHQLDLSWYAIHPIELLYALLGSGCDEVSRVASEDADVIVGRWRDGRLGTVRAIRPYSEYGAVVFRAKEILQSSPDMKDSYKPLVERIEKFFETGQPPVSNAETLEIFAFMDAAQRSKESGGRPEKLQ